MINENDYLNWIEGKKNIHVSSNGDPRFALIEKNGIPDMQFMVMLFYEVQALKPLSQIYTNVDGTYKEKFYSDNIEMLDEQTVIASYLGDQICLDDNGSVNIIDHSNFGKTFVNDSFDDFINFFILIDRLLGHVNYRVISHATKEQVEMIRCELEKSYNIDWNQYVFWDKVTRKLTKEPISEKTVIPAPKMEKTSMQTIIITLDASKLTNPDLDITYDLPDRIDEYTNGEVKDNGYDYLSDTVLGIWLETDNAAEKAEQVIKLLKEEKFADNDLSVSAEIYISDAEHAELDGCEKVYPV